MKNTNTLVTAFTLIGLLALGAGCGPRAQTQTMSDGQFQEKVRVFEADMLARLQDLETRLEMLQGQGLELPAESKDEWLESSETFENSRDKFRSELQSARYRTQADWNDYRDGMNKQWEAVEAAFQSLKRSAGKREE